jgi:sortase A
MKFGWLERGLVLLGLLLLVLWAAVYFEAGSYQSAESQKFESALRDARSRPAETASRRATYAARPATRPGRARGRSDVLGRIEIPRLHITAMVAEGSDPKTLRRAVGHLPLTALPGQPGNCALAGHRDTFLRGLGGVRVNDVIRVVTIERTYTYRVDWTEVVAPRRVDVLDSTSTRSLTLITCYPFVYVGHAPNRFVVRASQVKDVAEDRVRSSDAGVTPGVGTEPSKKGL